jgi:hypothetical protein
MDRSHDKEHDGDGGGRTSTSCPTTCFRKLLLLLMPATRRFLFEAFVEFSLSPLSRCKGDCPSWCAARPQCRVRRTGRRPAGRGRAGRGPLRWMVRGNRSQSCGRALDETGCSRVFSCRAVVLLSFVVVEVVARAVFFLFVASPDVRVGLLNCESMS